ncbi:uncharacterized protein VTP21DRAFT_277 [Calcarisporiella thermophila]|uniref:uncharacterized protein n=1 Tax=Calcarisporiella thermophila TaxID=911321 RepID=UPI003742BD21
MSSPLSTQDSKDKEHPPSHNELAPASSPTEAAVKDSRSVGLRPYILFCALIASLGSFNAGFNTGVPNIPERIIRSCSNDVLQQYADSPLPACLPMGDWIWGVSVGMFALGGLPGGLIANPLATRLGRRDSMMLNNIFFLIGGLLIATSTHVAQFAIGRFFTGIGSGFSTVVVSMYIAEMSPVHCRGALGTMLQLLLVVGILVSQSLGLGLSSVRGWRWLFAITVVPALLQLSLLPFCIRSPRWLISRNRIEEARIALQRVRGDTDIDDEFNEMVQAQQQEKRAALKARAQLFEHSEGDSAIEGSPNQSVNGAETGDTKYNAAKPLTPRQIFSKPAFAKLALIVLVIHAGSQLSGINGVMYYSTSIFEKTFGPEAAPKVTLGVGCLNLVVTLMSTYLMDRAGRKILLLLSESGMCIFSVLMVIASVYHIDGLVIASVMLFVASFAIGLGTVPWLIVAELFPTYAVGAASSIAIGINWFANFIIGLIFPALSSGLKDYTFLVFVVVNAILFGFTFIFLSETKGKSIEQLARERGAEIPTIEY